MRDMATCPECDHNFAVTQYGRRIACPGCGIMLDVMPDDPPSGYVSEADWKRGIEAKIAWLSDAAVELQEGGYSEMVGRVQQELTDLRAFLGNEHAL